jgi:predicted ArsR family transcriptional regulator
MSEGFSYDPELGPGYFVQTRTDFLRWPGFSPTFKVLYQVLCSYAGEGARAWPGQETLAEACGVSPRTIRTVLHELEDAGLVEVTQQGLNRPNLYHVRKLPTLERQNLPHRERQNLPLKTGKARRSGAATVAVEVHSVEIQTEEIEDIPAPKKAADMSQDERDAVMAQYRRINGFDRR